MIKYATSMNFGQEYSLELFLRVFMNDQIEDRSKVDGFTHGHGSSSEISVHLENDILDGLRKLAIIEQQRFRVTQGSLFNGRMVFQFLAFLLLLLRLG